MPARKKKKDSPAKVPEVHRSLRRTFGFDQLRPGQAEVIRSVLERHDTLAIMPTGAGKSLCYQLPALHLEGTTIVVSPLISLMKDQVDKLQDRGVEALEINSTLSSRKEATVMKRIERETSDFVFTTPERLTDPEFLETLRDATIDFVVIDEAHCISQWGHDFRPSYLALRTALEQLGRPPVLALTATATLEVIEDIQRQLGRPGMRVFDTGIYRPNLELQVEHVSGDGEKQAELLQLLDAVPGSGIIYTATVKHVEEITAFLQLEGRNVLGYHGRLSGKRRQETQDRFMAGELKSIVATNAFGLGIDKSDIRFVIHYDVPGSLEAYYQEAGRAGRDGEPARCVLLYDAKDRRTQLFLMGGRYPSAIELVRVYRALVELGADQAEVSTPKLQEVVRPVAKTKSRVAVALLKEAGIIREKRPGRFLLTDPGWTDEQLAQLAQEWTRRDQRDRKKLERMESYARSALCRWRILREYFGEEPIHERCGVCDNCRRGLAAIADRTMVKVETDPVHSPETSGGGHSFTVGDQVSLPKYGYGKVEQVDGDSIVVRFPGGRTRKFKGEFAQPVKRGRQKSQRAPA